MFMEGKDVSCDPKFPPASTAPQTQYSTSGMTGLPRSASSSNQGVILAWSLSLSFLRM